MVKVTVWLTPDEFRGVLPEGLRGLFDSLVSSLVEGSALSEEEAKGLVAEIMLDALRKEVDMIKKELEEVIPREFFVELEGGGVKGVE